MFESKKSVVVISAVVAAVTLITFSRILTADFVMWDDDRMIYKNPDLDGLTLQRLHRVFTQVDVDRVFTQMDVTRRYTPLAALNYTITYHFFKLNPFGYHLVPWLFHAANTVLLFVVLRKLLMLALSSRRQIHPWRPNVSAALAALLWSLHPLRVEPVAWAGAGVYTQALFFLLLSLLFYLRTNEPALSPSTRRRRLAASVGFFLLSLLSHPIGIGFLVVPVVLDIYPLRKIPAKPGFWRTAASRRALLEKIPFLAAGLAVILLTVAINLASSQAITKPVSLAQFSLARRLIRAMYIWAYYFWRPWYPLKLAPVYTTLVFFKPFSPPFIAGSLGVVSGTAALLLLRRRWPLGLTLGICHLVLLVPVLGLFEHLHYNADRYSLIVSICWSVLLAACLANPKTPRPLRSVLVVLSIVTVTALGLLSFRQTRIWNNSTALFEHTLRTLGDDPYRGDIHCRLGIVMAEQGNSNQAIQHFQQTLQIMPDHPVAKYQLDVALQSHVNQGLKFANRGKLNEAIDNFNTVLSIKPGWPEVRNDLADVYYRQKKFDLAVKQYARALRLKPDFLTARISLANTFVQLNKFAPAVDHYYGILQLKPNHIEVLNSLARILAAAKDTKIQNPIDAIKFAKRACELTDYENSHLLDTLAMAYAAAAKFPEAVETAEKALKLAQSSGQNELASQILKRIRLYKTGQAYIEK